MSIFNSLKRKIKRRRPDKTKKYGEILQKYKN